MNFSEPDDQCHRPGCTGKMRQDPEQTCSCSTSPHPPCGACTDPTLLCDTCGEADEDACGLCGGPGSDKIAMTAGYWPGQRRPQNWLVHSACEQEETERAWSELTPDQRERFLIDIG